MERKSGVSSLKGPNVNRLSELNYVNENYEWLREFGVGEKSSSSRKPFGVDVE